MTILSVVVALVLLIVCANVANCAVPRDGPAQGDIGQAVARCDSTRSFASC